ncbi:CLUMA_CG020576, isoform A [Clunio marinus]|uniref:CLUMA_CG020576, isoform A n=1 Tax=Clunio marinus TaxID=568069 RepID=A0A1J1J5C6_9DIPT|nr:CLUMA_CG020576, isoform A [Clunio marinus]
MEVIAVKPVDKKESKRKILAFRFQLSQAIDEKALDRIVLLSHQAQSIPKLICCLHELLNI